VSGSVRPPDPTEDLTAAYVLAVVVFLVFAVLVAAIVTDTFALDDRVVAWVGAGLVGLASAVFATWAVVLQLERPLGWAEGVGGDLLFAGIGVAFVFAGLPTFAAGVI
jgi:hypothetical protein